MVVKEFISSEESGEEDVVNGEKRQVMLVKPLPWRSAKVDRFFNQLDHKVQKHKSKQSKQQTLPRVVGERSHGLSQLVSPRTSLASLQLELLDCIYMRTIYVDIFACMHCCMFAFMFGDFH